jgi:hypothetical protein
LLKRVDRRHDGRSAHLHFHSNELVDDKPDHDDHHWWLRVACGSDACRPGRRAGGLGLGIVPTVAGGELAPDV